MKPLKDVILFDGVCNLCSKSVQFVIDRDPGERFRFCALQSDVGQEILGQRGLPSTEFDSLVLIDGDRIYQRSDAALRICAGLRAPWSWLGVLRVVPRPLRDAGYKLIARNRYRWFGRAASCRLPTDELKDRFL